MLKTRSTVGIGLAVGIALLWAGVDDGAGRELTSKHFSHASDSLAGFALASPARASAPPARRAAPPPAARPRERPLPGFSGTTLDGQRVAISDYIGQRLVLFFFNPEVEEAVFASQAVSAVAKQRGANNFEVIGIAIGSSRYAAREFAEKQGLAFPVIDDSSGEISSRLGLRTPVVLLGADAEGFMSFGFGSFPKDVPDPASVVEAQLREQLRLPAKAGEPSGDLFQYPEAPTFTTEQLGSDEPFDFASLAGQPKILMFFLHTCPHCHHAMRFLKEQLPKLPEDKRPALIAISLIYKPSAVRAQLNDMGLDFFPVLFDPDEKIRNAYGVFSGIPDLMLIDGEGRIVHRSQGWETERNPALLRMKIAKLVGARVPMLLNPRGYTGNDACGVCHSVEHATWEFTSHSVAFDTLVKHGEERNGECVSCHVVGFEKPGGYDMEQKPSHLENVGCESCHGRGGPHLSPGFAKQDGKKDGADDYATVCGSCHNPEHSLGFEYESFHPKISHGRIASLDAAARQAMIAGRGKPRDLLPKNADYVGSEACQSCHTSEYQTWKSSGHASAVATLADKNEANNGDCLKCHTTAFGKPGGFEPAHAKASQAPEHSDLARVGCESCHGPGGNHVKADATKLGSIVSLGDKCDSCVILQICGSCHDDQNDPRFTFEVQEKIDRQRHGSIEAGTGKPKDPKQKSAQRPAEALLGDAFAKLDARRARTARPR